ncbi:glycerophosphodiester phosphodiesterase [Maribellus comscasis]|uniref:Glycerophosphodiester phosphodiesterase n=1 Tax=Maribellus comscasis TaxID=2681766 RepID=A0A6I6JUK4_9BACT|nr:glycerophosphodiester phosphodiesterase family protein [Maribellus comscasis]QGY43842.1 glycerophosphodiester phosphodiesterase [Maribellus comscasis]
MQKKPNNRLKLIQILILCVSGIFLNSEAKSQNTKHNHIYLETFDELQQFLSYQGDNFHLISAHRGGPENNMPENCIATFENTINHTPSILEVDPRYTKDSVVILLHDPSLERTTTGKGKISDFTFSELNRLKLKDLNGNVTNYGIPTLNEALQWAKGKAILLLDKKDVSIKKRLEIVEKNNAEAYTIVSAYSFKDAKTCYNLNKNIMMQVFIGSPEKVLEFDNTEIPWSNIIAFVGHQQPEKKEVIDMIHKRGAICIMGTSRNLDLLISKGEVKDIESLKKDYEDLLKLGIDALETDIPVQLSKILTLTTEESTKFKYLH